MTSSSARTSITSRAVKVGTIAIGAGRPVALIAGPCVIEGRESALRHASLLIEAARRVGIPFIYKSSYDKANRTSLESYRGPGLEQGLEILAEVKKEFGVPILTDVHEKDQVGLVREIVDVLQIPAFLCRQTDFVIAVARAGKVVNVKKGQFLAPWDLRNVVEKIVSTGNEQILVTERGVSFGYNNLVSDMRSLVMMRELGFPVVFDATHSLQLPGELGKASGGQRQFIAPLARAGVAVGIDALFMEVHEDPDHALSDGPNSLPLNELEELLRRVKEIDGLLKGN
ncbi:MAG: 3-deoxy-8-phosphooctulonate synthase [Deltaproteobacteria bacterium GWA2_57_13]|nr:MAG: 3-deoxy-8-phosphooctulonate synthase [Deltaproteobacteria bacterium GWA2_57_13]OGQ50234.1 MAG: 3-deoxy-8-phosphooctulonate synthase [Deltaproteobacteria bacterium RIFCSPLOWO2_02_FULL_57_26]OGQ78753.1 MAG: 3-deoxy-8-phosphooctulonate synthase [Deltaproteobacteria bacterium RIFCSPLOWO2_12_FULL_57_22]